MIGDAPIAGCGREYFANVTQLVREYITLDPIRESDAIHWSESLDAAFIRHQRPNDLDNLATSVGLAADASIAG
jgi:hypothetical protein